MVSREDNVLKGNSSLRFSDGFNPSESAEGSRPRSKAFNVFQRQLKRA
jgi:hypothetical protein